MSKPVRCNQLAARTHIAARRPFVAAALSATDFSLPYGERGPNTGTGVLPSRYRAAFAHAVYAVYSYGTPIAWVTAAGDVIVPPVKYSVTSSRHQGTVRRAGLVPTLDVDSIPSDWFEAYAA